ncbi:pyridoxal phosphate-dependent transferase [Pseudoneurospora amorphoporcata]|uniref:Pyridoxal phosphate-dependent transferase n=1 Tax=Pseudoneurospora amorphoporcata TaxID=241081 RepID=A0AAN6NUJ5_9PEZI|nr:pyridoxal phosphate-dependent transferase [Pseudoneurospora amorphoporcata]
MSSNSYQEAAQALAAAQSRYVAINPFSKKQHERAIESLPGGNTRTLLHTSPFPLCMKHGKATFVWDEDGHKYTDFVGELSAGLYGHSHPVIRTAVLATFDEIGLSLGSTTTYEARYASLLCQRFKLERVRMANTGTEANLHALAAARHYTGKRKVVVFNGAYHGACFSFGGGEAAPNTADKGDFVVVQRYGDEEAAAEARGVIEETAKEGDLAAVLVEGMQGAGGCLPGSTEFLSAVQEAARKAGAVFILDEVMTSRLAPNGLGQELGLSPDLVTLGKYLGGGFGFGAFGGRKEIMDSVYDPRVKGSLAHSGTFNNNTMTMCAGYAGLNQVFTEEVCVQFRKVGDDFREKLNGVAKGTRLRFTGKGSLIGLHFREDGTLESQERVDLRDLFWFEMLEDGFWITRRGFIAMMLDTPKEELDRFVDAVSRFLERHDGIMKL